MYQEYDDKRLQEIENMVVRKIKKNSTLKERDKKELIEEIRIEGIEEFMGFTHLVNREWVENLELKEKVFSSKYQMRKAVNEYVNDIIN